MVCGRDKDRNILGRSPFSQQPVFLGRSQLLDCRLPLQGRRLVAVFLMRGLLVLRPLRLEHVAVDHMGFPLALLDACIQLVLT